MGHWTSSSGTINQGWRGRDHRQQQAKQIRDRDKRRAKLASTLMRYILVEGIKEDLRAAGQNGTTEECADILTKALPKEDFRFKKFRNF